MGINLRLHWVPEAGREGFLVLNHDLEDRDLDNRFHSARRGSGREIQLHVSLLTHGRRRRHSSPYAADEAEFLAKARRSRALHHPWIKAPTTRSAIPPLPRRRVDGERNHAWLVCAARAPATSPASSTSTRSCSARFAARISATTSSRASSGEGLMRAGLRCRRSPRVSHRAPAPARGQHSARPTAHRIALAKSCGFSKEGYSRRYLKIGGRWRDHERWAIVAS